jgi:hypothetical protein
MNLLSLRDLVPNKDSGTCSQFCYNFTTIGEITERSGWVVNTPTSYSGGPGFDSQCRRPAILIEVFQVFPSSSRQIAE